MKIKAHSYLRVSGKGQILGDGFPRQRLCIQNYCLKNNVEIDTEFVEKGVSGTLDALDRPSLTDLFVALKDNEVKLVLVENSSRLSRDLMNGEILLSEFRKIGVKIISAECGTELTVFDDNDFTKVLIRQILGSIAQFEKSGLVSKLRAARMRIKKEKGSCEGRKRYGVTEQERVVIAHIFDLKGQGLNPVDISRRLNETGQATRAGKETKWHPPMISRILARV